MPEQGETHSSWAPEGLWDLSTRRCHVGVWHALTRAISEAEGLACIGHRLCPCSHSEAGQLGWRWVSVWRTSLGTPQETVRPLSARSGMLSVAEEPGAARLCSRGPLLRVERMWREARWGGGDAEWLRKGLEATPEDRSPACCCAGRLPQGPSAESRACSCQLSALAPSPHLPGAALCGALRWRLGWSFRLLPWLWGAGCAAESPPGYLGLEPRVSHPAPGWLRSSLLSGGGREPTGRVVPNWGWGKEQKGQRAV